MNQELIQEAIKCVELIDVRFNAGSLVRDDDFDDKSNAEDISQQTRFSVSAQVMESSEPSVKADLARVKVEFGARYISEESEAVMAEVIAEFIAVYEVEKGLREEALQEFFKFNVVHNVWPFWREHLLRLTSSAGLPRFVAPLYKQLSNPKPES